jgi:ubiquinone/menaquinone biosynthesis C-methylase UbiE
MSWSQYLTDGIDFSDVTVLDAATGAGGATLMLARKIAEAGGNGKVISVDIDPNTFPDVRAKLAS